MGEKASFLKTDILEIFFSICFGLLFTTWMEIWSWIWICEVNCLLQVTWRCLYEGNLLAIPVLILGKNRQNYCFGQETHIHHFQCHVVILGKNHCLGQENSYSCSSGKLCNVENFQGKVQIVSIVIFITICPLIVIVMVTNLPIMVTIPLIMVTIFSSWSPFLSSWSPSSWGSPSQCEDV